MEIARRYLLTLAAWTGGFTLLFVVMGVTGPGGQGHSVVARLPALLGFAVALGAFPTGIAMGRSVLHPKEDLLRRIGIQSGLAIAASLLMYITVAYWAPSVYSGDEGPEGLEAAQMTSGELRAAARDAHMAAQATASDRISDWQEVNAMAWELDRRLHHSTLPFLLTWVGIFAAHWAGRARRREVRLAMLWAMGLFIFMSLYLAGENSFELIAMRAGGPVYFAASFILFVPAALFGALGWTTAMDLFGTPSNLGTPSTSA